MIDCMQTVWTDIVNSNGLAHPLQLWGTRRGLRMSRVDLPSSRAENSLVFMLGVSFCIFCFAIEDGAALRGADLAGTAALDGETEASAACGGHPQCLPAQCLMARRAKSCASASEAARRHVGQAARRLPRHPIRLHCTTTPSPRARASSKATGQLAHADSRRPLRPQLTGASDLGLPLR